MRIIDADVLKDNMFHYAAPEMVWDRCDIEHKIDEMPTIPAIPVEWLRKYDDAFDNVLPISNALRAWEEGRLNNG